MNDPIQLAKTIHSVKYSPTRAPFRRRFLLIALCLALVCFTLAPITRAVNPPPDGGYPGENTAEGDDALLSLTTGRNNTAIGDDALKNNTTGNDNTANGDGTLTSNISGSHNTANGSGALSSNTTGVNNTATGASALLANTTGSRNTANGNRALSSNTTGIQNTAMGDEALINNTTGSGNTATGFQALFSNTTGVLNTATGFEALFSNRSGILNTATGISALVSNTIGDDNTTIGVGALANNTTGSNNAAIGDSTLPNNTTGFGNTAIGSQALFENTAGGFNIALGIDAGFNLTTGVGNIDIGSLGVAGESNKIRIGTKGQHNGTFIAGISGVTVPGGVGVIVDTNGHLGTVISSERYKDEIKPMAKASEAILALEPVTFRYKHELDPEGITQFGLVAEQVEKVNPDLVARDAKGEVYTVRYEAVNAMLLNEFLKAHSKMEEQEATIAQLKKGMEVLTASLKEQASQIQKVSDKVELSKPTPRTVINNQ